ncbi:MAG TPA: peptidoglycan DD-metalloendopeptidase family protein [Bryobacteraceae bacterium]|nr:peptidoglycan DD-metalloendopeptidase family protein [Bryobacteraceae bacterium]HOL70067.1 peptidoglycan DD-metalloendopeptidase family protein [Bryobacteraceae bacterium]HOQ46213.1 peptidoglycan DD-metalloendopeptidase family protein [Bryobacteraceae bacterium]HPQ17294.1 peptidoglycan DD-metalloendopeptidase family protein [Bryobacteraceae bacterium]HPU74004.1 peptidoglycan DD-metalloendopeptidase family protein [Bryobacteraceae bacterium]
MKQQYFILVLAHSMHGRLRRVQIPHRVVYLILGLAVAGCFSVIGAISSYARMAWKVADYNSLRQEISALRQRYQKLQSEKEETHAQLANLQLLASEISMVYGLKQLLEGPSDISQEGSLLPTVQQSIEEYDLLRTANLTRYPRRSARFWQVNTYPSMWPVEGTLRGYFGNRTDPFSGEGAFHRGVDISAPTGTPVRAAADGYVVQAQFISGYGRTVIIDHGNGLQTLYAHLSSFAVVPGQEIRQGEMIGAVGSSGRATAPHLHYEVRRQGRAENPIRYMGRTQTAARRDFPF